MIASTTIQNVPRDLASISALSLSHQYKLVYQLGILDTEDQKSAFHGMRPEERAQLVLDTLNEYDKTGKGTMNNQLPLPMPMQQAQIAMPPGGLQQPQLPSPVQQYQQPPMQQMPMPQMPGGMPQMPGAMPQMPGSMPQPQLPGGMPGPRPQMPGPMPSMMSAPQQTQPAQSAPAPQAAPASYTTDAIRDLSTAVRELAESMQQMLEVQKKLSEHTNQVAHATENNTKICQLLVTMMIPFIEAQTSTPHDQYVTWLKSILDQGYDKFYLNQLLGKE